MNIQTIFTKIRNELNNREDKLLLEVDEQFEKTFFDDSILKNSEKLPKKIKISLEKCKKIDKEEYEDNQLINEFSGLQFPFLIFYFLLSIILVVLKI